MLISCIHLPVYLIRILDLEIENQDVEDFEWKLAGEKNPVNMHVHANIGASRSNHLFVVQNCTFRYRTQRRTTNRIICIMNIIKEQRSAGIHTIS